ncbi:MULTISPECIES: restriction endonuclease subunit S [Gammaproteobacteria]|nr:MULTISPECIES: restriction endonuclease subunit S [Gammaproteobacteria]MCC1647274.1 restriction endonuclease subunit S [Salmonella enterica subsp. enterica serovar Indiana]ANZ10953.1 restriction modification system, specificity subunit [Vibrio parahaemolyticus]EGR0489399.1 restriction endonuclease subunit S [Vibrio cholerae]EGR0501280.1 restriction endonuclease subunit S [Vibrio cholerae]EGR1131554.1 restriction endonuclease subunit S [Vibrio cholerae]
MTIQTKAPDIRFENFSGDWQDKEIGSILAETRRPVELLDNELYQLVTVKRRNEGVVARASLKGKDILVKNYFGIKSGDYLISKRQVVHGANGIVPESLDNAVVSNEYLVVTDSDEITAKFWTVISKRHQMHKLFFISSYGVDIEKLVFDVTDWKSRVITIPDITEQSAITDYFRQLDGLINQHQQKHDKLSNIKNAMLEKMFPKQGKTIPEIRFKGFSGEWMEVQFKSIAGVRRGLTYKPDDIAENGIIVLRSSNINVDRFELRKDDVQVNKNAVNINRVKNGDILITSANGSSNLVGKHVVVCGLTVDAVHGGFMLLAETDVPHFLNASMNTYWYDRFRSMNVSGGNGAIGNIKGSALEEEYLYIPKKEEQIAIGNYFQKLDALINQHQQQIIKLNNIKQACLSKMFV